LGFIDTTFHNHQIYWRTSHDHIKQWLSRSVYGYIPTPEPAQTKINTHRSYWKNSYGWCTSKSTCSQNFEKFVKPKGRHPLKILTKHSIKNKKLYR